MKLSKKLIVLSTTLTLATACVGPEDENQSNNQYANQDNPVEHSSPTIDADITWSGTHVVSGGMEINSALTIEPCSRIEFSSGALSHVRNNGSISAVGTEDCPIIFTSTDAAPGAGDWQRFDIWASASNSNRFEHVIFEYGGADQYGMVWIQDGARAAFSNVTFRHATSRGLDFEVGADITEFSSINFEDIGADLGRMGINAAGKAIDITSNSTKGLLIRGGIVTSPTSLAALEVPYDMASIEINDELTLEAGVTVQMTPNALHHVRDGGSIKSMGTAENQVLIQSNKSAPAAGDWQRFDIWDTASSDSSFSHTTIRHGGGSGTYGVLWIQGNAQVELDAVTFEDNHTCDVDIEGDATTVDATNTTYTECD